MPYRPKEIERKYYGIGEVAEMFSVAPSLIRFWETEFEIIKPRKNRKGNRQFTVEDIENIKLVYHLVKEKGYTLQGAKEMIKTGNDNSLKDKLEVIKSLEKVKEFLNDIKNQLGN
jgi:DNA-binding transcriptional MerR regulator